MRRLIKFTLLILFIILAGLASILYFRVSKSSNNTQDSKINSNTPEPTQEAKNTMQSYYKKDYKLFVYYPGDLVIEDVENKGGYLLFAQFGKQLESTHEGFAVGVNKGELLDETERIKSEIKKSSSKSPDKEEDIKVQGYPSVRLTYKSGGNKDFENKTIVLIKTQDFVYSISTVPENIDFVLANFKILPN